MLACALLLAAAACAGASEEPGPEPSSVPAPAPPDEAEIEPEGEADAGGEVVASDPVAEEREAPAPSRRPVTIAFAGDVHAERGIGDAVRAGDDPLTAIGPVLAAADIAVINLETAVGEGGEPEDKSYLFRAPPELWPALADAGVDVVSLANNHALDYGVGLLPGMLEGARAHGLHPVGAGPDDTAAYAPARFEIDGRRVAVVGLTRVIPRPEWAATPDRAGLASAYDLRRAAAAVEQAAEQSDHVVVTIHWGTEGADCPDEHQLALAEVLVDAGADVVAGHHPHVLQGVERRGQALIAYSLGNFLWYSASAVSRLTGVLAVTLNDDGVADWHLTPAIVRPTGSPEPAAGVEAGEVLDRLRRPSPPAVACP